MSFLENNWCDNITVLLPVFEFLAQGNEFTFQICNNFPHGNPNYHGLDCFSEYV